MTLSDKGIQKFIDDTAKLASLDELIAAQNKPTTPKKADGKAKAKADGKAKAKADGKAKAKADGKAKAKADGKAKAKSKAKGDGKAKGKAKPKPSSPKPKLIKPVSPKPPSPKPKVVRPVSPKPKLVKPKSRPGKRPPSVKLSRKEKLLKELRELAELK